MVGSAIDDKGVAQQFWHSGGKSAIVFATVMRRFSGSPCLPALTCDLCTAGPPFKSAETPLGFSVLKANGAAGHRQAGIARLDAANLS